MNTPPTQRRYAASRRSVLRGTAALGAIGALTAAGVACGGDDDAADKAAGPTFEAKTQVTTEEAATGGAISLAGADVTNLDYQTSFSVLQTLYTNRLLRYKTGSDVGPNQYELTGDLAASWENTDPTTVTVKLTPGVLFHQKEPVNGRALDSGDVKATFDLLNTNKPSYVYRYLVDFIDSIATPDANTVVFKLKYPTPLIFKAIAYYNSAIAPREVITRDGNLQKIDIGTGPFTLDKYDKGVGYTYKKNPNYFVKDRPYVDGVTQTIFTDAQGALDAFRTGKLDALDLSPTLLDNAKQTLDKSSSTIQTQPGVGWGALWFNAKKAPFDDLRVRQAFHFAIDRAAINALVTQNQSFVRTGPIARGWSDLSRSEADIQADAKRDVAKAKALLAAAGFADGLETDYTYSGADTSIYPKIAQVVQQQLKDAGINITLKPLDATAWNNSLQVHEFGLSVWTIRAYPDADDYLYPFFSPGGAKNFGQVDDPTLTALILKERQETDAVARKAVLQEIDRRWTSEFAYAQWTIEPPFAHVFSNSLRNYSARNPTDYAGLANAFLKRA